MDSPLLAALAELDGLTDTQQRSLISVVAQIEPYLLLTIADRKDLTTDTVVALLCTAPSHLLPQAMERIQPDQAVLITVAEISGASPALVIYCGRQGWTEQAAVLAERLGPEDVETVVNRWAHQLKIEPPDSVYRSLLTATFTETEPRPALSGMSDWERSKAIERLRAQEELRTRRAWRLLERIPHLWEEAVQHGPHVVQIQRVLLKSAHDLPDAVLRASLPQILGEQLREHHDAFFADIRLAQLLPYLRRWPRLRQLFAENLVRVLREAVEDGWTPHGERYSGPSWHSLEAVAELTTDAGQLAEAVAALKAKNPWAQRSDPAEAERWDAERADAAAALAANPRTPPEAFLDVLPMLDEAALRRIQPHLANTAAAAAVDNQLQNLAQAAESRQPHIIEVPSDRDLAQLAEPMQELRRHLRHLRGRAQQRDATCDALLRSAFTDDEILKALPAKRVLNSPEQAARAARMISDTFGDDPERWKALTVLARPPAGTFGQWLEQGAGTTAR
ncbi:hypothetical protein ACQP2X_35610 [Actinoplanes sp. CA-131856]